VISLLMMCPAGAFAFVVAMLLQAGSDLVSEEIRGWLEVVPGAILRMAAMHLPSGQRLEIYREVWLPDLLFITRKAEGRPITKFVTGTKYSLAMLRTARRQARDLRRAQRRELAVAAVAPQPLGLTGIQVGTALPCADDPDLFFAESPDELEEAKSICHGCPVKGTCLAGAIDRREPWGVWGGQLFLRGEPV
jgi:hypothetical protein